MENKPQWSIKEWCLMLFIFALWIWAIDYALEFFMSVLGVIGG